jgi:hypothetical protein
VGFLASWWVGLIAAWLLARLGLGDDPPAGRRRRVVIAFSMVGLAALVCGACAALYASLATWSDGYGAWEPYRQALGLANMRRFVIVAWLHNGSYAGALLGFLAAATYNWRRKSAREAN